MRKRTLILFFVAAGIVAAAIGGFTTIRRGFSARDNSSAIAGGEDGLSSTRQAPCVERSRDPEKLGEVHAHVVIRRSDGTAHSGHLLEARVRATCDLILTESPSQKAPGH